MTNEEAIVGIWVSAGKNSTDRTDSVFDAHVLGGFVRRSVGLRPTPKHPGACEKNSLVLRVFCLIIKKKSKRCSPFVSFHKGTRLSDANLNQYRRTALI